MVKCFFRPHGTQGKQNDVQIVSQIIPPHRFLELVEGHIGELLNNLPAYYSPSFEPDVNELLGTLLFTWLLAVKAAYKNVAVEKVAIVHSFRPG